MTRGWSFDTKWWSTLFLWAAVIAGAVIAFFVLRIVATTFWSFTRHHEAMEPAALLSVHAWLAGGFAAMYPADWTNSGYPLILTPYPPLFHAGWLVLSKLLGGDGTYLPGRLIADAALVGCCILIYRTIRLSGASRLAALPFTIAFVTPVPVAAWAGVARVDIPGIFFTLLGLYLYLRTSHKDGYAILLASVPFILAGLTKQNLVAAPGAVVLAELIHRRYLRAGIFAAVTAGGVLLAFLAFDTATGGGFFNATVRSLADEIFFRVGLMLAADFLASGPSMAVLFALAIAPALLRNTNQPVVMLYVVTSLGVLALTIGKPGSNVNYYLEPIAALCIAGGWGFWKILERDVRWGLATAVGFTAAFVWSGARDVPDYVDLVKLKRELIRQAAVPIQLPPQLVGNGPVLAPPWSYLLIAEPRPTYYTNDDYTFALMAMWDKLFHGERVVEDLRSERITAVLATRQVFDDLDPAFAGDWQRGWHFWSAPNFREALFASYTEVGYDLPPGLSLFLPKSAVARWQRNSSAPAPP